MALTALRSFVERWIRSPRWFWSFLLALGICILLYSANGLWSEIDPRNLWGLAYGTAASLLMLGAALFGVRRRMMKQAARINLGSAHQWLQFHLYGGTLALVLVFMHTGFRIPDGALNWWLWFLSIWVTLSGLVGVMIQKSIPRIISSALATEVLYERVPELVGQIKESAEQLIEASAGPVKDFYRDNIAPSLLTPQPKLIYYIDITGGIQANMRQFEYVRRILSVEDKERLDRLESIYRTKLEIDAQYTLQKALRWWAFGHVPPSLVLLLLIVFHLYAVFYY